MAHEEYTTPAGKTTTYWVYATCGFRPQGAVDRAVQEMRGRVAYWNTLVALAEEQRAAYRTLRQQYLPAAVQAFAARYEAAERAEQAALRRSERAAYQAYRAACQALAADTGFRAAAAALEEGLAAGLRAARGASGLYWCNYSAVEDAWRVARRVAAALRYHSVRRAATTTSVRWQTGLPVATLLAGLDTRAQLVPDPDRAPRARHARRGAWCARLRVRVGSNARRGPVWLELPVVVHRPLPAEGRVRQIHVRREAVGLRWRWWAAICCEVPAVPATPPGTGTIAIDIGWRRLVGEVPRATRAVDLPPLRVAAWRDDRGGRGDLVLPPRLVYALTRPEAIQSQRALNFNAARDALAAWRAAQTALPEWFAAATAHVQEWRAPGRLHALLRRWRDQRVAGDAAIYARLEAWRQRDKHLWQFEATEREQARGWRRDLYRRFAAWVARTYAVVRLEEFDLRRVATRAARGGQADELPRGARHMRVVAAVHTLRQAIEQACARAGVRIEWVPAAWTTQRCCVCGQLMEVDAAPQVEIECPHCRAAGRPARHDQDLNAAQNLLDWQPPDGAAGAARSTPPAAAAS